MPTPREDEDKNSFMKRCMEQLVGEENRPKDQAYAICNSLWENRKDDEPKE